MTHNKETKWKNFERIGLSFILLFILINAIINQDNVIALISAICGITYTFLAGKGLPICYIFGVTGSSFYGLLAFQKCSLG
jgi:nicotinamide riboside transporter PnuC